MRISSPPFLSALLLWHGYSRREEQLIAYNRTIEEIRQILGADSLAYLRAGASVARWRREEAICTGCFSRKIPH